MSVTGESFSPIVISLVVGVGAACHSVHGSRGDGDRRDGRRRGRALGWGVNAEGEVGHSYERLEMKSDTAWSTVCTSLTGSPINGEGCTLPCSS